MTQLSILLLGGWEHGIPPLQPRQALPKTALSSSRPRVLSIGNQSPEMVRGFCHHIHFCGFQLLPLPMRNSWQPGLRALKKDDPVSYLSMWQRARERQEEDRLRQLQQSSAVEAPQQEYDSHVKESRESHFASILQVPSKERDKVQRMQVVDRAAAALAAAQALLAETAILQNLSTALPASTSRSALDLSKETDVSGGTASVEGEEDGNKDTRAGNVPQNVLPLSSSQLTLGTQATPGPDFWTWSPPLVDIEKGSKFEEDLRPLKTQSSYTEPLSSAILEKERPTHSLDIPYEWLDNKKSEDLPFIFQSRAMPSLPPLQSLLEVQREVLEREESGVSHESIDDVLSPNTEIGIKAASVAQTVLHTNARPAYGINSDGSQWWKETGEDLRDNGVVCKWTVTRGVSADGAVEWEEKFWEAFDELDYKELGAEKSGRDASGNVWREVWKEAIWQDLTTGISHIEKMADKWAKDSYGAQWHEKWSEHYDASGHAEKWADKWCQIDPTTPLEPGHAHVWHERWGETYDGQGGSMKYTDKWAERADGGGQWSKWGDKWDEHFDKYSNGVKQGETWWEGAYGERWNRTWGEQHNGTGWVHKYGQSSSGEHWDTHEQQDTWYERYPHFGFYHCLENSHVLRQVGSKMKPSL